MNFHLVETSIFFSRNDRFLLKNYQKHDKKLFFFNGETVKIHKKK